MKAVRLKETRIFCRFVPYDFVFMRKLVLLFFFLPLMAFSAPGKSLEAFFSYCTFYSPESGPYIETYLSLVGRSVEYVQNENGKFQGSIEVTYIFKQGDEIKNWKKYNILSPEVADTSEGIVNFLDQQRIQIPNGQYDFEIQIADNNSDAPPFNSSQAIELDYPNSKISISEVELVESYEKSTAPGMLTKSGYDLIPYVSDFFPESVQKMVFYAELYNTEYVLGEGEGYLVNYFIESTGNGQMLSNFRGFKRKTVSKVDVLLGEFNITNLASGNYNLVIEIRNRQNEEIGKRKLFFQRSNPAVPMTLEDVSTLATSESFVEEITHTDTLRDYIRSTRPISSKIERSFVDRQLKKADLELMQQYFLSFWKNRDDSNPHLAWLKYQQEVAKVNKFYSTKIRRGYETDRGRVYLQYGPPNAMVDRKNISNSYPYEIWQYYQIESRSNARFVFYYPDLSSNDYVLLHSNVYGEQNNPRWEAVLQGRNGVPTNLDEGGTNDQFGNPTRDLFTDPR